MIANHKLCVSNVNLFHFSGSAKPGVYVKVKQYLDWIKEKMDLLN